MIFTSDRIQQKDL